MRNLKRFDQIFSHQPLNYVIQDKMIVVSKKEPATPLDTKVNVEVPILVTGKVTDTVGSPLIGATVRIKGNSKIALTDSEGKFTINAKDGDEIEISYIGYESSFLKIKTGQAFVEISMHKLPSKLNEVQVIGYGKTTKRLNTGSVSTISAADIEKQPVTNLLSALSGRASGVFVQTTNGLPGGNVNIQIRGKGSVNAGTTPLCIIDDVPFSSGIGGNFTSASGALSSGSVNGPVSPFNSLNPDDIESISILKDADATSIYGSRGSNGVVLITTKKGRIGKTKLDITVSQGINKAAELPRLLNLQQYLQIRHEAYANDGLTSSADPNSENYAPDLTVWDPKKSTDWPQYLLGGTGHVSDAQATVSGGNEGTIFAISGSFHTETNYLLGDNLYTRGGIHYNLQHTSADKKFLIQFSGSMVLDNNQLANPPDISSEILLPPNYPLFDSSANYNWFDINPLAETKATSKATTDNLINNLVLSYKLLPGLSLKTSAGYNELFSESHALHLPDWKNS
jgi:TonB-linked SusC/RagA family outer membrane protein